MTPVYISDFHSVCPKFLLSQDQSVKNMVDIRLLMNQKRVALDLDKPIERKRIEAKVQRFGLANSKIKERRTEVGDYVVVLPGNESELTFFNSAHLPTLDSRMSFYSDRVQEVFKEFYPVQKGESAPDQLIHVSCTGYSSPSPAQRIVAQWEKPSTVTHAYHMGCYASLPALRLARGLSASAPAVRENEVPYKVDIVHNELCSLHVNPLDFDPQQMVVQSLFADGHMKYSMTRKKPKLGFEVLSLLETIVPNTTELMTWTPGSTHFVISLSREVPGLFNTYLKPYLAKLFEQAGISFQQPLIYAIHPGGPKIIETVEAVMELTPDQTIESHDVLTHRGNMSSATLPHIWEAILKNPNRKDGAIVVCIAFGPGITISGGVFRLCRS